MTNLICLLLCVTPLCHARHWDLKDVLLQDNMPQILDFMTFDGDLLQSASDIYSSSAYAQDFLNDVNRELRQWKNMISLATWDYKTDLNNHSKSGGFSKMSKVEERFAPWNERRMREASKFNRDALPENLSRQLYIFTLSADLTNETLSKRLSEIENTMLAIYGTGKACLNNSTCLELEPDMVNIMAQSRDPELLKEVWVQWRNAVGPLVKPYYAEFIKLLNIGAVENGYQDYSEYWIESQFYNTPDLDTMIEQLWREIKPFYLHLHAFVRRKLRERYGEDVVGTDGTIRADLLSNMWAQHWADIIDVVGPFPEHNRQSKIEANLKARTDVLGMFQVAEKFFKSIGLFPMTRTFWTKSMMTKPEDREVVCHASASDLFSPGDFRIKMCADVTFADFKTVHHEMGHIEYFMAYARQPTIFRAGANSAFHEAMGDTIQLSVLSTSHLEKLGLVDQTSEESETGGTDCNGGGRLTNEQKSDITDLLSMALEKVAFIPFGLLVDKWRWDVMEGNTTPENYNRKWWELRLAYQGVRSPVPRSEMDFDPGAKYHIPNNSPYINYFFSYFQQFQMYKALCEESGHKGPLHKCDFYGSRKAGAKLRHILSLGASQPWQQQLKTLTGSDRVTSDAILEYFKPLYDWLVEDNARHGEQIGWEGATINWKDN